jgi:hypothetical protein
VTLAVSAIVLVAAALALVSLARAIKAAGGRPASRFERALARPGASSPPRVEELQKLETAVVLGLGGEQEYGRRLAPVLREAAAGRLAVRRGLQLERADEARAALGAEAWELVRPDRLPPEKPARGPSAAELRRAIEAIEDL